MTFKWASMLAGSKMSARVLVSAVTLAGALLRGWSLAASWQVKVDRFKGVPPPPIRRVLILLPEVEVRKVKLSAWTREERVSPGASEFIRDALGAQLVETFQKKGLDVIDGSILKPGMVDDSQASAASKIVGLFRTFIKQKYESGPTPDFYKDVEHYAVQRDLLDLVFLSEPADGLVLTYARGATFEETAGAKVLDRLPSMGGGWVGDSIDVHIAVIGSQTGTILFYCQTNISADFVKKPERMFKPVEVSLRGFFRHIPRAEKVPSP